VMMDSVVLIVHCLNVHPKTTSLKVMVTSVGVTALVVVSAITQLDFANVSLVTTVKCAKHKQLLTKYFLFLLLYPR
jgi:hypothetical protein